MQFMLFHHVCRAITRLICYTGAFCAPQQHAIPSSAGQLVAGFVAIVAVAIFAVPTSILGGGFMKAVQQSQGRELSFDCD